MPTDHEAHGHRSSGCGKSESAAAELTQLRWESTPEAEAENRHDRVCAQALSGPRQDSDVNAKEEEAAWCRSVQEATRSTWRNVRERTVRHNAAHGAP